MTMKYYRATVSVPGTDKVGEVDAYAENEDSLLALVRQYTNEPTAVLSNIKEQPPQKVSIDFLPSLP